jgi:competence protein ComGF
MRREKRERQKKVRVCIRLDSDLLDYFQKQAALTAHSEEPTTYETLINKALRYYIDSEAEFQRILASGNYSVIDPQNPPPWWKPVGRGCAES